MARSSPASRRSTSSSPTPPRNASWSAGPPSTPTRWSWQLEAAGYAFVATRMISVGDVATTVLFAVLAVGFAWAAAIWPAAGRAYRRNIEAAEHAALALKADITASGTR